MKKLILSATLMAFAIAVQAGDALTGPLPATDVAVANITGEALPFVPFRSALVIASGYLATEEIGLPAYARAERRTLDGWAADLFRSHPRPHASSTSSL